MQSSSSALRAEPLRLGHRVLRQEFAEEDDVGLDFAHAPEQTATPIVEEAPTLSSA